MDAKTLIWIPPKIPSIYTHGIVIGVIAGVLFIDTLEAGKCIIIVSALHHKLRTLRERKEPETKQ